MRTTCAGRLQEARWLMSSLELRNQTLMRVSQSIVDFQQDFLEQGEMAMKPLVLKEISEAIGVHESTVSRATTRKYMLTPRGLFELKYFFSSHVQTDNGGTISATAVKARLQLLLDKEPPGSPLSDQELSELLRQAGILAARRTVAKYRESLGIGSSNERRRLYRRVYRPALKLSYLIRIMALTRQLLNSGIRLRYGLCNPSRSHQTDDQGP